MGPLKVQHFLLCDLVIPLEEIVSSVLVPVSLIRAVPYESWRGISNENDLFLVPFHLII